MDAGPGAVSDEPRRGDGGGMGGRGPGGGFRGTSENAKTRLCTRWLQGDCRFGDRCNFAHGETELRKGGDGPAPNGGGRGGYGAGPMGGRGGGRMGGGGYPGRGMGMGMGMGGGMGGGYPGPGRGRGMYDMGYGGGGGGGGYGGGMQQQYQQQQQYGGPMEQGRPANMPEDVWAAQGHPVAGPNSWFMYRTKETGESYFHNHRTNQTIWERPAEWPANGQQM